jgi:hypothetical protein
MPLLHNRAYFLIIATCPECKPLPERGRTPPANGRTQGRIRHAPGRTPPDAPPGAPPDAPPDAPTNGQPRERLAPGGAVRHRREPRPSGTVSAGGPAMSEKLPPDAKPPEPPIKDPNPPEAEVDRPPPEVPKVGSRDAPGG